MQLKKCLIQHKHMKLSSICMSTHLSPTDKNTLLQRKLKLFDSTWKTTPCLQLLLAKANTKFLLPISYQIFFPVVQFFLFPHTKKWDGWLETYSESFQSTHTSFWVPENRAHHWTTFTINPDYSAANPGPDGFQQGSSFISIPHTSLSTLTTFQDMNTKPPQDPAENPQMSDHACMYVYLCMRWNQKGLQFWLNTNKVKKNCEPEGMEFSIEKSKEELIFLQNTHL